MSFAFASSSRSSAFRFGALALPAIRAYYRSTALYRDSSAFVLSTPTAFFDDIYAPELTSTASRCPSPPWTSCHRSYFPSHLRFYLIDYHYDYRVIR